MVIRFLFLTHLLSYIKQHKIYINKLNENEFDFLKLRGLYIAQYDEIIINLSANLFNNRTIEYITNILSQTIIHETLHAAITKVIGIHDYFKEEESIVQFMANQHTQYRKLKTGVW